MATQRLLALLGLALGIAGMIWLAVSRGGSLVLGGMNGLVLEGILAAVLAGQVERRQPPTS